MYMRDPFWRKHLLEEGASCVAGSMRQWILDICFYLRNQFLGFKAADDPFAKRFCQYLKYHPSLLTDRQICPLFIVLGGLWSSARKKMEKSHLREKNFQAQEVFTRRCLEILLRIGQDPHIHHDHMYQSTLWHWLVAWDRPLQAAALIPYVRHLRPPSHWDPLDAGGRTPLTLLVARKYYGRGPAAQKADEFLADLWLRLKARADIADALGNTVLHYAVLKRDHETLASLLKYCPEQAAALWDRPNRSGQTPLALSCLSYEAAGAILHSVYEASTLDHILCRPRWENTPCLGP